MTEKAIARNQINFLPTRWEPRLAGSVCGLIAAVGYTAANICLRAVADSDPVWVSCIKALPTVALAGPWLLIHWWQGRPLLSTWRAMGLLVAAGTVGQLFGNVAFQYALGIIGMALTVPLVLGTLIVSGAVMGRVLLHEPVTYRAAAAMAVLIGAIVVLSLGAGEAHQSVAAGLSQLPSGSPWTVLLLGILAACLSGLAYSILGTVIRHGVRDKSSIPMTLFVVAVVGTTELGGFSMMRIGIEGMLATTFDEWVMMIGAGVCNAIAFLALTKALQLTTMVYVNALNASQVAMAAVAGVIIFQEAPTLAMWTGVGLTALGLMMMRTRPRREV